MNQQVEDGESVESVARSWLDTAGLLADTAE